MGGISRGVRVLDSGDVSRSSKVQNGQDVQSGGFATGVDRRRVSWASLILWAQSNTSSETRNGAVSNISCRSNDLQVSQVCGA